MAALSVFYLFSQGVLPFLKLIFCIFLPVLIHSRLLLIYILMREIRIDDSSLTRNGKKKNGVRDVEVPSEDLGFEVNEVRRDDDEALDEVIEEIAEREPGEMVRVKFDKFVQLVATHNFEDVLKDHSDEDIVMNSNLLMDLASAHEDTDDSKKQPLLIGIGVAIGVAVAFLLFTFF